MWLMKLVVYHIKSDIQTSMKIKWNNNSSMKIVADINTTIYNNTFGFVMDLSLKAPDEESTNYVIYSTLVSILILFQIYTTLHMNKKIIDNFTNSGSISIFTVGQNTLWNAYGCLFHFFIAVNNEVLF